ncbi:MAG: hypothetical protein FWB80_08235 [Defluviitaleaceae bacterium]|nr:hypothetical protein [Defluviitaleaceae bacterium]
MKIVDVLVKLHYKQKGEHIEKILHEAVVQHIKSEAAKNGSVGSSASCSPIQPGWSQNLGGTTCIQK